MIRVLPCLSVARNPWLVLSVDGLTDRERLLEQRLRIGVAAPGSKDVRKIVEQRRVQQRSGHDAGGIRRALLAHYLECVAVHELRRVAGSEFEQVECIVLRLQQS